MFLRCAAVEMKKKLDAHMVHNFFLFIAITDTRREMLNMLIGQSLGTTTKYKKRGGAKVANI